MNFDAVSFAIAALPRASRMAVVGIALIAVARAPVGGTTQGAIFQQLIGRIDWDLGMTGPVVYEQLSHELAFKDRTIAHGVERLHVRGFVLPERVPGYAATDAARFTFPALLIGSPEPVHAAVTPIAPELPAPVSLSAETHMQRAVTQNLRWRSVPDVFWCWLTGLVEAQVRAGAGDPSEPPHLLLVRNGQLYGLQLRPPGRALSQLQRSTQERMRSAGAIIATTAGVEDALARLQTWGLIR